MSIYIKEKTIGNTYPDKLDTITKPYHLYMSQFTLAFNHSSGKLSKSLKKTMSIQTFFIKQKNFAFISLYLSSFLWVSIVCTFKLIDVLEKHASFILNLATKYIHP